ncbi:FtsX-like permease family protein [Pseudogemmobacter sp. W21_MBD1_M6]|uniref:ABC transporter permease n=1 Tax=Pseudogemmobacter sp. W21_MBD1_M6 TaxID=3240271 RepID=UPI003F99F25C
MRLWPVMAALLSHWWRRPFQLLTLVAGLALSTALWSGVQAINAEARASYARAAATLGQGNQSRLEAAIGVIAQSDYITLRRAGWLVSPVIEGTLGRGETMVRLVGIEVLTAPDTGLRPEGGTSDLAAFLHPAGRIFANAQTAKRLTSRDLPPVIVDDSIAPGLAVTDIGVAQRLLQREGQITRLILSPDQPLGRPPLAEIAPDLVLKLPEAQTDIARLTDSFHLNLTAFGFLAFAVGLFIVHAAIGLAFEQRRPVFRTLRALGVPALALMGLLAGELLILALVSGGIGVVIGYGIAAALLPDVAATLRGLYGASVSGTLSLHPSWWVAGVLIAVLGTIAAASLSLWRVWRLPLLAAAQPRAWARASERGLIVQSGSGAALLFAALLTGVFGEGLIAGFALLGAFMLGAVLLLPLVLQGVLAIGQRCARGPLAQWFWADTRQQVPGLSLALMALLLALAANIGVGTMVSSFRLTFTAWLDQRLAAELYLTARDQPEADRLAAWLAPRVDAVLPIASVPLTLLGAPGEVYGMINHATYRDNWPLLDATADVWDALAAGRGVLVNEQLARRKDIAVGDTIDLTADWQAQVTGVFSDYGNPMGQVLTSMEQLTTRFPETRRLRFAVRIDPARVPDLREALTTDFGLPADGMVNQAAIKAFSLNVFERTFSVTAALNVLTLGVAGFAILTSLLTLSAMRLPQLAPVWALGVTRKSLARVELLRACLLAVITMVAALPVGLMLAWVLLAIVNVAAFGWRLPMHIFPSDWLVLGLLALIAAVIASALPVWRLMRVPPAELLKVFANER